MGTLKSKVDSEDLSVEISAASAIISGLSNQCCDKCYRLQDEYLRLALFGVSRYLDRIAIDLEEVDD